MNKKKRICILGSTGSIGRNALRVISDLGDRFEVSGLSAHSNIALLAEQVNKFRPAALAVSDKSRVDDLRRRLRHNVKIFAGRNAHEELARQKDADIVLIAITGSASIRPTYAAVSHGRDIALASKEALVSAGHIIMREAKRRNSSIIPVDSEHSAVFQCLAGNDILKIRKLYITSSGGPLRKLPKSCFKNLSPRQVLDHPKWKMGKKISVDSATMINKGLEVIEAKWLFGIDVGRIEILIHPEAVVHSMIEFIDGSLLAQLGVTDMRLPIQYALSYPERYENRMKPLDLPAVGKLTFYGPDTAKFPSLKLVYDAAREGGSAPCVLNAANEALVKAFLSGRIKFTEIPVIIEKVLSKHKKIEFPSMDEIDGIARWAESEVERFLLISIIIGVIGVVVVLSVMILSHEFGHFIVAKKMGVKVEVFSFGFGRKVASFKKGDTEYVLSLIPFGGYVKMAGDELSGKLEGKEWEFYSKPIHKRFNIIVAGSVVNYILGFLLFCFMCMAGEPVSTSRIGAVREGYPAEKAGLKKNDIILSINEKKINSWDEVLNTIHNRKEGDITLEIDRDGKTSKITVRGRSEEQKDIFGKPSRVTIIGIECSGESKFIKYGLLDSIKMGARKTWELTVLTYQLIWKMLTGAVSPKAVAGPIGIFAIVGKAANMGINYLLYISALISVSLAIFNLLPFPILDGGHILFLAIEKMRGKPVSAKTQDIAQNIAFALLIAFMLFVSWNDILNLPKMFK